MRMLTHILTHIYTDHQTPIPTYAHICTHAYPSIVAHSRNHEPVPIIIVCRGSVFTHTDPLHTITHIATISMYMFVYVCVRVCVCVCLYVCMYGYICMCICLCACVCAYMCVFVCVHVWVYMYVCMCVCLYVCEVTH